MQPAPSNDSYKYFKRVRSRLINAERCSHAAACHAEARRRWVSSCCHGQQSQNASTERGGYSSCYLAMIAMALCSVIRTQAQEPTLPSRTGQPGITIEEVIVTGSNIPTVDLNLFPLGLIDHIDILKDGASAIYGSDAVGGVFNVWLIHKFRGLEIYASYGNANLGASNDQGEERAYLLAGTGDDKTDIVVYAEVYNRAAIYSRDRDISSNADFTRFGGLDNRSDDFAGRVGDFVYQPSLNRGAGSPTRHAFPDAATDPQYVPLSSLPQVQQRFNYAALTPAMAPVDREYLYGSLDTKICGQYLEFFGDFKYVRGFWDGALAPDSFAEVFTDANHPFGISPAGISVPIQNPFNPFSVADYTSPGGANPKVLGTQISDLPPGT